MLGWRRSSGLFPMSPEPAGQSAMALGDVRPWFDLCSRVITCARGREMRCLSQEKKALMGTQMTVAVAAAAGFLAIAAFQAALALGAPVGRAAWGGIHARLPVKLRIASAFAVGVWMLAALIILGRAGSQVSPLPPAFARWGTWILFGVNLLAALMNFASHSSWERFLWAPAALILAVLCLIVALNGSPVSQADRASASIIGATARATRATTAGDRCGAFPRLMQRNTPGGEML
jgi:hypothetical protein